MAFGTLASTLLTLFVIPLVYYLWQRGQAGEVPAAAAATSSHDIKESTP